MKKRLFIIIPLVLILAAFFIYRTAQQEQSSGAEYTCTFSVTNGDDKIIPPKSVTFLDGESVFDILTRETKSAEISLDYSTLLISGAVYVQGIADVYEFDEGASSGWVYLVNGEQPAESCSKYLPKNGDLIEWLYKSE
ncbi:hypothetical protein AGMMS49975_22690 [Clostridia bacterium]|nr:hypothetical protein AGMMS49975_22690 [Clostridia bacterium]